MPQPVALDKFARSANLWLMHAQMNLDAARVLFTHEHSITLCIPAAGLGHLALEGFLKSFLIDEGFTIFDPKKVKLLPAGTVATDRCAWGHDLVKLARLLASNRPTLDLQRPLDLVMPPYQHPLTLKRGLEIFNSFFEELRYPQHADKLEGVGPDDIYLLEAVVAKLIK